MHQSPRDVAVWILDALFADEPAWPDQPGVPSVPRLTPFQEEGARRVRTLLDRWGGAILADAVGLGKTHIALDICDERARAGHEVVVVVPASLRHHWRPLLSATPGPWRMVSHTQLSRGTAIRPARGPRLVVVDEAHRFRNPKTRRYAALARLVSGVPVGRPAEVLLVTATPVNNDVEDLYSLVRLFLPDDGLREAGVPSLRSAFRPGGTRGSWDPALVRAVVRAVQVRRSRAQVEQRFGELSTPGPTVGFPRRAAPSLVRYDDDALERRVEGIEALRLEAYAPGAAPLIRLGLLKRLDSGPAAFAASTRRLRATLEAVAEAARAGRLLRPGVGWAGGDIDPLQLSIVDVLAEPAPPGIDLAALLASTQADDQVLQRLMDHGRDRAPKLEALLGLVQGVVPSRVVVFTEYRDTAAELWRRLLRDFRVGRVDGGGAWLGARPAGRRVVVERFAPMACGRPTPPDREGVDVLIATDVLSEGLNLQDAAHVVSYDLPWNPVRLLQRIGRVERLGSPHPVVFPHLFVPVRGLDAVLGLTRKVQAKLEGITTAVGEPRAEQLLEALTVGTGEAVGRALARFEGEAREPWDGLRTLWLRTREARGYPEATALPSASGTAGLDRGRAEPRRLGVLRPGPRAVAGTAANTRAVVLARVGRVPRLLEVDATGAVREAGHAALGAVRVALDQETAADGDCASWATALAGAGALQVSRFLRAETAASRAPARLERSTPEARMARRLRQLLARAGSGLDRQTIADAEAAFQALQAPLPPATGALLDSLLAREELTGSPTRAVRQLVDALGVDGMKTDRTCDALRTDIAIEAVLVVGNELWVTRRATETARNVRCPKPENPPPRPG